MLRSTATTLGRALGPIVSSLVTWKMVRDACDRAVLYAPFDGDAWEAIARAQSERIEGIEGVILATYAPGGVGFETLVGELSTAPLLADRRPQVLEVIQSVIDGRHYVAICGALPLAEGTLALAHGRWQSRVADYPLEARLKADAIARADQVDLLLNASAVTMVCGAKSGIWYSGGRGGHRDLGGILTELNRHRVLHGTARGWETKENAVYALLFLAAAARVAGPLLGSGRDRLSILPYASPDAAIAEATGGLWQAPRLAGGAERLRPPATTHDHTA
jgi:hypothetical protein